MSHFAVALVCFILGFWFAGLELWPIERWGRAPKKTPRKNKSQNQGLGYSFDSEGRPVDD